MTEQTLHGAVPIVRALNLLLGRIHLALAGVRPLTIDEEELVIVLDSWWRDRLNDGSALTTESQDND